MYDLDTIHAINDRATVRTVQPGDRDSSYCAFQRGVILHSARLRSTVFIDAAKPYHRKFLTKARTLARNQKALNRFIESHF